MDELNLGKISAFLGIGIAVDQALKQIARIYLPVTPNAGAFMSLGADLSKTSNTWLFVILSALILSFMMALVLKRKLTPLDSLAVCFLVAGSVSNLIDRIVFGSVTNFISVPTPSLQAYSFNFASLALTLGLLLLIAGFFRQDPELQKARIKKTTRPS